MNDLISLPKCTVSLVGAQFAPDITFEEWAEVGKQAKKVNEAIQWVLGDWLNYGDERFRQAAGKDGPIYRVKYEQALQTLPYEYQTLRNFAWVAKAVNLSRRRDKLSFRHHAEVAAYEPKKQIRYLDQAEKNGLSVADLRELIRRDQAEVDDATGPGPAPSPNHWANQLSLWCQQQDPGAWPKARRDIVKQDLQPIVEFYKRL